MVVRHIFELSPRINCQELSLRLRPEEFLNSLKISLEERSFVYLRGQRFCRMPVIFWSSWDEVLAVQYFIWTLTKSTLIQKDLQLPIPLAAGFA
jgi:hypothetical protein